MEAHTEIKLLGDDNETYFLSSSSVNIHPSLASALDYDGIVASNKIKIKPAVKYFWEYRYYFGRLICSHQHSSLVAYCINNKDAYKTISMVRIRNSKTTQKLLLKNFSGKVVTMEFAYRMEPTLAVLDQSQTLRVYKISPSGTDADLLAVECILVLLPNEMNLEMDFQFLCWCPWIPNSSSGLYSVHKDDNMSTSSSDMSMLLSFSSGKTVEIVDVSTASQEFKARFPNDSLFGVGSDRNEISVSDSASSIGLTRAGLSNLTPETDACFIRTVDHGDVVTALLLSVDASFLLTACLDGFVRVFNLKESTHLNDRLAPIHEFSPHDGTPVHGLYFVDRLTSHRGHNPDSYLVTGSQFNRELRLWSTVNWTCLQTLRFCAPRPSLPLSSDLNPTTSSILPAAKPSLIVVMDRASSLLVATDITRKVLYILGLSWESSVACNNNGSGDHCDLRFTSITEFLLATPCIMFALGSCQRRNLADSDSTSPVDLVDMEIHAIHTWYLLNGTITFDLPQGPRAKNHVTNSPDDAPANGLTTALDQTEKVTQRRSSSEHAETVADASPSVSQQPIEIDNIEKADEVLPVPEPALTADSVPTFTTLSRSSDSCDEKPLDDDTRPLRPTDFSPVWQSDNPISTDNVKIEASVEVLPNHSDHDESASESVRKTVHTPADTVTPPAIYRSESIEDAMKQRIHSDLSFVVSDRIQELDLESKPLIEFDSTQANGSDEFNDVPNASVDANESYQSMPTLRCTGDEVDLESVSGSTGNAASLIDFPQDGPDDVQCFDSADPSAVSINVLEPGKFQVPQRRTDVNWSTASLYSCSSRSSTKQSPSLDREKQQADFAQLEGTTDSDSVSTIATMLKRLLVESDIRSEQMRIILADMKETKEQIQLLSNSQVNFWRRDGSSVADSQSEDVNCRFGYADEPHLLQPVSTSSVKHNNSDILKDDSIPPEWSKQILLQLRTQQGDFARRFTHLEGLMNKMHSATNDLHETQKKSHATKPITNIESRLEHIPKLTSDLIRPIIRSEIQNAFVNNVSKIVDPLQKAVTRILQDCTSSLPLLISENVSRLFRDKNFTTQLSRGLSTSLSSDLSAAYRDSLSKIFVPALEKNIKKLFEELNTVFHAGTQQYLNELERRIPTMLDSTVICDQIISELKRTINETTVPPMVETGFACTAQTPNFRQSTFSEQNKLQTPISRAKHDIIFSSEDPNLVKPESCVKSLWAVNRGSPEPTSASSAANADYFHLSVDSTAQKPPVTPLTKKEEFARLSGQARILIQSKRFAEALELALISTNQALVLDVCNDIDPNQLFTSGTSIGQNVLLSLIHQLSCGDFRVELELKIRYLQQAVYCLNRNDPTTIEHGPRILTLLARRLESLSENCSKGAVTKLTPQIQSRLTQLKRMAKSFLKHDVNPVQ